MSQVAKEILAQLGGNKFLAMVGAKNLLAIGNGQGLQFDLPRGAINKANKVQVVLSGQDLYSVAFYQLRGLDLKPCGDPAYGVGAENLAPLFQERTGLRISL